MKGGNPFFFCLKFNKFTMEHLETLRLMLDQNLTDTAEIQSPAFSTDIWDAKKLRLERERKALIEAIATMVAFKKLPEILS